MFLAATLLTWSDRSQVHSAAELDTTSFVVIGDSLAAGAGITSRVRALNSEISGASKEAGALVYDLNAAFGHVRASGLTVGDLKLTADYLGGFYSLSGSFPGTTGHALIANEILTLLNQSFQTSFATVDLAKVAPDDPAVRFRPFAVPGGTQ